MDSMYQTPLVDVVDKVGTVLLAQIIREVPKLNAGVRIGLTVTVNVIDAAHCPGFGVNVYTPELVLLTVEGLQVPLIPFVELLGRVGTVPDPQMIRLVPNANVGVVRGITVIVLVIGLAHCPPVGVNVYVPVAALLTVAGLQVPESPLVEVVGNGASGSPEQIAVTAAKVGVMSGLTVTCNIVIVAHCAAVGVNI